MGSLTKNFSTNEFTCRCCGVAKVKPYQLNALQELRDLAGRPIVITSAYRCPTHNKAIGGSSRSRHVEADAADLVIPGMRPLEVYHLALKIPAFGQGGIGLYLDNNFIHLDSRPDGPARWARISGKYTTFQLALDILEPIEGERR